MSISSDSEIEDNGSSAEEEREVTPDDLIKILNGIRDKFNSLSNNVAFRVRISTLAPDCGAFVNFRRSFSLRIEWHAKTKIL